MPLMNNRLTALLLPALLFCVDARADAARALQALLEEHWQQATREQVFFRTDPDAFRPDGRLPEFSATAIARRQAFNDDMLARLEKIDEAQLKGQDLVSYRLLRYERETERASHASLDRYFPFTSLFGYFTTIGYQEC